MKWGWGIGEQACLSLMGTRDAQVTVMSGMDHEFGFWGTVKAKIQPSGPSVWFSLCSRNPGNGVRCVVSGNKHMCFCAELAEDGLRGKGQ